MKKYKFIAIGFPIYLMIFDSIFRYFLEIDISQFIGPTLAASGLSLIVQVLRPKLIEIPLALKPEIEKLGAGISLKDEDDESLIFFAWIAIGVALLIWLVSCYYSLHMPKYEIENPDSINWYYVKAILAGIICYISGSIFKFLKDE